ncbi:MAG: glycoside hydrolase family 27 protein [Chitinophagales bacterium]|nr:glycoside hydrolase family 27 protein [Chitinophagales bacterium]
MKNTFILAFCFSAFFSFAQKKDLASTPPMGWNSWNHFHCDVNETLIKEIADAMLATGMASVGYEYVVIDDCWQIGRDENGILIADRLRFPSGMKSLADYVHSKGLKFGIYSDAGKKTCQERPGSLDSEAIDAKTFAEWGVDYIKYDWCHHGFLKAENIYPIMGAELANLDREIVYSVCNWGWGDPWLWAPDFAHLWRTTWDVEACFDCKGNIIWKSVEEIIDLNMPLAPYAKPGAWNDPDMLEVGNGSLTEDENMAHFALWCMMAAPLMAGNDLRNMEERTLEILSHKELIQINQDPLGIQAFRIYQDPFFEIWLKPLQGGSKALSLFNRSEETIDYQVNWKDLLHLENVYQVKDLINQRIESSTEENLKLSLRANSVLVYRLDL